MQMGFRENPLNVGDVFESVYGHRYTIIENGYERVDGSTGIKNIITGKDAEITLIWLSCNYGGISEKYLGNIRPLN